MKLYNSVIKLIIWVAVLLPASLFSQNEINLFQQFNGRYDYLAFGNTMNIGENTGQIPPTECVILTESSADYSLGAGQTPIAALLYWAGVGTGDLNVELNGTEITAERVFNYELSGNFIYFAAYADVTDLIVSTGPGNYTLSELDLTLLIPEYCENTTNFAGWAINVIYEDLTLPLNQVNVFDGLEGVSALNNELTILIDNLLVLDNEGAKIGFTAWEGDESLAVNETLQINGNIISNPPLNPPDNQFNGTNSFTGNPDFYNMDLDFYNIENNIQPGDTSATITLTSGQDLVMINNVITVLNTELPDATIEIDNAFGADECGDRDITVEYTVYNVNSTDVLPANTPIAFYANTTLVGQAATTMELPIGGSESGTIDLNIPLSIPPDFELKAFVDDDGTGQGIVQELNEDNNGFIVNFHLLAFPVIQGLDDLELCDVVGIELFDLTEATSDIDPVNTITYHNSEEDALDDVNPISNPTAYENMTNPETIWIRVSNPDCWVVDSFEIEVIDCPLPDATIDILEPLFACRGRDFTINYIVSNLESTGPLPAATPIAFYIEGNVVAQSETQNVIPIGGSEDGSVTFTLTPDIPNEFILVGIVDDIGDGTGIVQELNEFNNDTDAIVLFGTIPPIGELPDLIACNEGFSTATFDLTQQNDLISSDPDDIITYYTNEENAIAGIDAIQDPENYMNVVDPQRIYVRLDNIVCFAVGSFNIAVENCPPFVPQGFSPNEDTINDEFEISGLLNVFDDFRLQIYSREGNLIYDGGNDDGFWNGIPNTGLLYREQIVPVGTYYYVLQLNDEQFPDAILGFVYVNY
jgi:gliding motility-associated-like protein